MAITSESIDRALYDLGNLHAGPELAFGSDPTNLEMARLLAVVDTVKPARNIRSMRRGPKPTGQSLE